MQDLYLHQIIQGHTRENNLLGLFFCNDLDINTGHNKIENVLFSDHTLCLINTLIAPEPQKEYRPINYYTTDIPLFDLLKAEAVDWDALNLKLSSIDWDLLINEKTLDKMMDMISTAHTGGQWPLL